MWTVNSSTGNKSNIKVALYIIHFIWIWSQPLSFEMTNFFLYSWCAYCKLLWRSWSYFLSFQRFVQSLVVRRRAEEAEEEQEGAGRKSLLSEEEEGQEGRWSQQCQARPGSGQGGECCESPVSTRVWCTCPPAQLQHELSQEVSWSRQWRTTSDWDQLQSVLSCQEWEQVIINQAPLTKKLNYSQYNTVILRA